MWRSWEVTPEPGGREPNGAVAVEVIATAHGNRL